MIKQLKAIARLQETAHINLEAELKTLGYKPDNNHSGSRGMYFITYWIPKAKSKSTVSFQTLVDLEGKKPELSVDGLKLPKAKYSDYDVFAKDLLDTLKGL